MTTYKDEFIENGFCIIKSAVKTETVNITNNAIDILLKTHRSMLHREGLLSDNMLTRVVNLHHSVSSLKQVFFESMESSSKITDLYGRATLYTSLFFEKGSQQSLHRDTPYFYTGNQNGYMGVWAALDDVTEDNGALIAVKGSHKIPEPDLIKLKNQFYRFTSVPSSSEKLFNAYNEKIIAISDSIGLEKFVCKVSKGDIIVWHPSTLHGGMLHKDLKKTRRSFVMHITPKNTPVKHMDFFFNREKAVKKIKKEYDTFQGRLIEKGNIIDFMHKKTYKSEELGIF